MGPAQPATAEYSKVPDADASDDCTVPVTVTVLPVGTTMIEKTASSLPPSEEVVHVQSVAPPPHDHRGTAVTDCTIAPATEIVEESELADPSPLLPMRNRMRPASPTTSWSLAIRRSDSTGVGSGVDVGVEVGSATLTVAKFARSLSRATPGKGTNLSLTLPFLSGTAGTRRGVVWGAPCTDWECRIW